MTIAHETVPAAPAPVRKTSDLRLGLLGVGAVGSAVARLAARRPSALPRPVHVTAGLVRDLHARRAVDLPFTTDAAAVLDSHPDVVVEVLGGIEPARTLVLDALARRIPVVTANKSLLARHADELSAAAARTGTPLRFEAAVLAGVPFLGTLARRPLASAIVRIDGIVNGTTNYVLTQLESGTGDVATALADATRQGYAEPDPSNDVDGIDAAEKVTILVRELTGRAIDIADLEVTGIRAITGADLVHARRLGGTIKPVVHASSTAEGLTAFAGPAFVPATHPLASLHGVTNGVCLRDEAGSDLLFAGPGAGPDVTAVTILDDVIEASGWTTDVPRRVTWTAIAAPSTRWFVRLGSSVPAAPIVADLLGALGIGIEGTSQSEAESGSRARWLLTSPATRVRIERATEALQAATGCSASAIRAIEARS